MARRKRPGFSDAFKQEAGRLCSEGNRSFSFRIPWISFLCRLFRRRKRALEVPVATPSATGPSPPIAMALQSVIQINSLRGI
jgi:hypothetical protein